MGPAGHLHASYAERFRCIGPACEDCCCGQWTVPVDEAAYGRCQTLPAGAVRALVEVAFVPVAQVGAAGGGKRFAQIRMTEAGMCPLLADDGLCRLHEEFGEGYLPQACGVYPRAHTTVRGEPETGLALSCPEAARVVLLGPGLMVEGRGVEGDGERGSRDAERVRFLRVRDFALRLLGRRSYPLWQRLMVLGLFSRRLDAVPMAAESLVGEFDAALAGGQLGAALAALETNGEEQMDVVLRLAGLMLHRSQVLPRFEECLDGFRKGIGYGPGATLETLARGYGLAHDRYFAPFFDRHPQILENYLTNLMVQSRFPFGKRWAEGGDAEPIEYSMTREFLSIAAQFVLMTGMLIGVAGFRREGFREAHVVATVQALAKHFEHHPEFAGAARTLLVESRMDGMQGLATLLRDGAGGNEAGLETGQRKPVLQRGVPGRAVAAG